MYTQNKLLGSITLIRLLITIARYKHNFIINFYFIYSSQNHYNHVWYMMTINDIKVAYISGQRYNVISRISILCRILIPVNFLLNSFAHPGRSQCLIFLFLANYLRNLTQKHTCWVSRQKPRARVNFSFKILKMYS